MRKVILFTAVSLDSYIARIQGEVDWLFTDNDYGYDDFYQSIDTTLMGHNTYQQILSWGNFPYPEKINYVFSKIHPQPYHHSISFINNAIPDFVNQLKAKPGKNIWLVGGSQINTMLLNNDLIDEMILAVHPIILGQGIPLFTQPAKVTRLDLQTSQIFARGLVQMSYRLI
ncbi:bifunctional deaminase-reductase domain-containing protein [Thioploca ingrica]|uniref:Bifunctional deaminase-reductase domain-containing protein n=1 Tax=Thioploca ingrica TaxID=40754 RepID=A0A090ANK7_9GAMM|nr:bifunctional deaminase-reductase domain-containing protein [Thioploca ingrica]